MPELIPMPGLDGYGIIEPWLPLVWQRKLRRFAKYGIWVLFAAFWFVPVFNRGFWSLIYAVSLQLGVPSEIALFSLFRFQQGARLLFLVFVVVWIAYSQWQKRFGKTDASAKEPSAEALKAKLTELDEQLVHQRNAATLSKKAAVLTQLEQHEEALVCLNQALDLRTDVSHDWILKGYLCNELKDYLGAIAALQSALKLRPDDAQHWESLGRLHETLKQNDEAIAAYEKAAQYAKKETDIARILALQVPAYFYHQQYQKCLDTLDQLIALRPDQPHLPYNQACCYARLGHIEPGMDALAKALSQDPTATLRQDAKKDEDLNALHSHPDFAALIEAPNN